MTTINHFIALCYSDDTKQQKLSLKWAMEIHTEVDSYFEPVGPDDDLNEWVRLMAPIPMGHSRLSRTYNKCNEGIDKWVVRTFGPIDDNAAIDYLKYVKDDN
jgi:hypothetical protein